ncbi:unnamed protein product [Durusdinium trenchii]|uniref:Uncharacterized protein n=1 Tax=Durusdinium trenchii TaxID=1381693 RepID=A0ABP0L8U1_9DINO
MSFHLLSLLAPCSAPQAINRMKLQGVSKDQQEVQIRELKRPRLKGQNQRLGMPCQVILEEMDALLRERSESAKASAEMESNEFSTENVQESDLFRVQEEAEESAEMEDSRMQDRPAAKLVLRPGGGS